jgi:hypothetical protein
LNIKNHENEEFVAKNLAFLPKNKNNMELKLFSYNVGIFPPSDQII